MAQWFSALAAMAMLSARTWARVPPTTSRVFAWNKVSPLQSNLNANRCAMCPNYLARGYQGLHVKQENKKYKEIGAILIHKQNIAQLSVLNFYARK